MIQKKNTYRQTKINVQSNIQLEKRSEVGSSKSIISINKAKSKPSIFNNSLSPHKKSINTSNKNLLNSKTNSKKNDKKMNRRFSIDHTHINTNNRLYDSLLPMMIQDNKIESYLSLIGLIKQTLSKIKNASTFISKEPFEEIKQLDEELLLGDICISIDQININSIKIKNKGITLLPNSEDKLDEDAMESKKRISNMNSLFDTCLTTLKEINKCVRESYETTNNLPHKKTENIKRSNKRKININKQAIILEDKISISNDSDSSAHSNKSFKKLKFIKSALSDLIDSKKPNVNESIDNNATKDIDEVSSYSNDSNLSENVKVNNIKINEFEVRKIKDELISKDYYKKSHMKSKSFIIDISPINHYSNPIKENTQHQNYQMSKSFINNNLYISNTKKKNNKLERIQTKDKLPLMTENNDEVQLSKLGCRIILNYD